MQIVSKIGRIVYSKFIPPKPILGRWGTKDNSYIKTDLANHVNVDLDQMKLDVETARSGMPYIFCEMKNNKGIENIAEFLKTEGGLEIN